MSVIDYKKIKTNIVAFDFFDRFVGLSAYGYQL